MRSRSLAAPLAEIQRHDIPRAVLAVIQRVVVDVVVSCLCSAPISSPSQTHKRRDDRKWGGGEEESEGAEGRLTFRD